MNIFAGTRRLTTRLITLSLLFVAATGSAAGLPSGQQVHVQSPNTGHYLVAEGGGGGDVRIDRVAAGPWETFTLIVEGGGSAADGSRVRLRTSSGSHYVAAQLGGGHGVDAVSTNDGPWETFTLVRLAGPGTVDSGDLVALRADNGQYVVAEGGGGGVVNANRDTIGPWESFVLLAEGAPSPGSGGTAGGHRARAAAAGRCRPRHHHRVRDERALPFQRPGQVRAAAVLELRP